MSHTSATATNALITPTTAAMGVMISSRESVVKSPSRSVCGSGMVEAEACAAGWASLSGSGFMSQRNDGQPTRASRARGFPCRARRP